jgi:MFS family permease
MSESDETTTSGTARPPDQDEPSPWGEGGTLILLVLLNAGALGLQGLLAPLTVELQRDLKIDEAAIGLIQTGFLCVYAAATPLWGFASAHCSRRGLLILASLLWGGCCAALAFVDSQFAFTTVFWIAAVGNAAVIPLTMSMAVDVVPPTRRGVAFGWLATGQTLGMGCAFLTGGLLVESFGWQLPFLIFASFGGTGAFLLVVWLRHEPQHGAMETELQELFESGSTYDYRIGWSGLKRLFATHTNSWLAASTFLCSVGDGGLAFWFIEMLRDEHGFKAVDATWLTVGLFASQIPGAVLLAGLADRVDRRSENGKLILLAGMTVSMAACYFIGLSINWGEASITSPPFAAFLVLLIAGAFVTAALPPLLCNAVNDVNPPEHRSLMFSVLTIARLSGRALGVTLVSAIAVKWFSGELAPGLAWASLAFLPAGLCILPVIRNARSDRNRLKSHLKRAVESLAE